MTFTLLQNGAIGTTGTGTVTCTLPSASTAGTLLVAAVYSPSGGTPFTAPAGWLQAAASGGSSISLGVNDYWWNQVTAAVTGVTTSIAYYPASSKGAVEGIPPQWPSVNTTGISILNFSPTVAKVISGALDSQLTALMNSAPAGAMLMPYHEVNLPGTITANGNYTQAQIQQMDRHILALKNSVAPGLKYARGLASSPVRSQGAAANQGWVTPGMDAYGMDGYQGPNASATPDSIFGSTLGLFRAAAGGGPAAKVYIIETGTNFSLGGTYTATHASPCVFTVPGLAPVNGTQVTLSGTVPGGFTAGTVYFAVASTGPTGGSTFELAATSGGSAINSTSAVNSGGVASFTTWFDQIYSFAVANNLSGVQMFFQTPHSPGQGHSNPWIASDTATAQRVSTALSSAGSAEDTEIWWYPKNPGGISSVVFNNAAGANCRGSMAEFQTSGADVQVLDVTPGTNGGPAPATSFPVATADSSTAGDLGIAAFGDEFSATATGTWTVPTGYTLLRQQGTGTKQPWSTFYNLSLPSGVQSVTSGFSVSTNQVSWGAALAVFLEVAPVAVTAPSFPAGTTGKPYDPPGYQLAATGGDGIYTWAIASGALNAGLSLSPGGLISGTFSAAGTSTFTVTVTDGTGATATSGSLSITAAGAGFPAVSLGLACELNLGGTWTDITTDAVQPGNPSPPAVTITRGRPDETTTQATPSTAAFQLNNRTGSYTARNPTGPYYGLLNRNTPVRWSVAAPGPYLRLEADASSQAAAPSTSSLDITGAIDIRIDLTLSSYMPGVLAAKGTAWTLLLNGDGTLTLSWTPASGGGHSATSTQPLPALGRIAIRATLATGTATVKFWTAPVMAGTFTQLGASLSPVGSTSIISSPSSSVAVGNYGPEAGTSGQGINGSVWEFQLYSGVGGTLVADPVFTAQTAGVTSFTDGQGNTWTLYGTAAVSDRDYRFHGELAALPVTWDPTGTDVWAPVTAAGVLRRLGQGGGGAGTAGGAPVQSPIRRAILAQQGDLYPVAYWPMEDATATTMLGSATGAQPASFTAGLELAADSNFLCSAPLPTFNGSQIDGYVPSYPGGTGAMIFRFLLDVPSGESTPDGTVIMRVLCTRTVREFTLRYKTGGALDVTGWDATGNNLFDSGAVAFAVKGKQLWVSMELQQSGANVNWSVTTLQPGASTGLATSGTTIVATVGNCTGWQANPNNVIIDMGVGHVQVQSAWVSLFSLYQPLNAWQGETAGNRFARLCAENGITARVYGFPLVTEALGAQPADTLGNCLQDCEDSDRGQIYEPRQVRGLAYRTLASMCNQAPAVAFDYSQDHLSPPLLPVDDDYYSINDVTATDTRGSSYQLILNDGSPMSITPPPQGIGDYAASVSVNLQSDSQLPDVAGWVLHLGTNSEERYPSVAVDLADTSAAMVALAPAVKAADIGSFLTVVNQPAFLPPGTIRLLLWGVTELLGDFTRQVTWNCVPETPYETALCGDLVYGRADTDGSALDADIGTGDTTLTADATGLSGLGWTQASSDWPFDITMGGEQMTVTAVGQPNALLGNDATFDTGTGNWVAVTGTIAQAGAPVHTGTGSLQMTGPGSGNLPVASSCAAASIITGGLQVTPGDQLQVSAWFLAATTSRVIGTGCDFYNSAGTQIGVTVYVNNPGPAMDNTSTWTQWGGIVVAPAGAAYARLTVAAETLVNGEVHYVDDAFMADLSASGQQLTVTRSVNGVVKAHSAGEDIRLAHPAILAMN